MKIKHMKKYIIAAFVLMIGTAAWLGTKQVAAAVQTLQEITAYYTGDEVEVGGKIDTKDIYVMATYLVNDGYMTTTEYEDVKKGFTVTPSVIEKAGENRVVVSYRGKTAVISVMGKTVESITATYTGDEVYVGADFVKEKVEVVAYFTDGSYKRVKDFTASSTKVTKVGLNTFPIVYGGKVEYIYVYGKAPLAVEELYAYYDGEPVIAGNSISKSHIVVQALYNDGTLKDITNFNISPSIAEVEGINEIEVIYGDVSTTIEVYGEERYITEMTAKYTGPGVIVGKTVDIDDIEVIVTYNDGSSEDTDDFSIYGEEIRWEGENVVLVYCDSFSADVTVQGVKGFAANYDNSISNYFFSADLTSYTEVTLGMNMGLEPDKFSLKVTDNEVMERAVQRVVSTEDFIAFELAYDDDEMVLEFPMALKVTVPEEYDPDCFGIYYTPNRTSIMAKLDGEFLDEDKTEYQVVVYEPGVYVLVHEVANRSVTDIIVEEELKLKVNRNFSLNPVVFPINAENKELTYTSTDEDVATVSENGKIRTYQEGSCEIWIETQDDSGVYVVVYVEVVREK